jgi:hypothetical protein
MAWFKIDDSFYDHPKVFDAPDCAVALWTRAGTWSARNLTDGFVPTGMPARLCDDHDTAVRELLRRGLWLRASGGYRFHDWASYQPSKESVENLRAARSAAGKRGGQVRAAKQTASKSQAIASDVAKQNAAPARPGPILGGALGDPLTPGTREAPPPRCQEHIDDPTDPPCGRCADARRARGRWDAAEGERLRNAPKCRRHRGQLAHNCSACRSEALAAEVTP